jgi:hypothetical protein
MQPHWGKLGLVRMRFPTSHPNAPPACNLKRMNLTEPINSRKVHGTMSCLNQWFSRSWWYGEDTPSPLVADRKPWQPPYRFSLAGVSIRYSGRRRWWDYLIKAPGGSRFSRTIQFHCKFVSRLICVKLVNLRQIVNARFRLCRSDWDFSFRNSMRMHLVWAVSCLYVKLTMDCLRSEF